MAAAALGATLSFGSGVLGQLENVAQVAQLGQSQLHQREQIYWARRNYMLDSQSVRLDALDHAKEEIKSHYDTYVGRIDTLLLVLALIFPFALNVIQFSDPFVPATEDACPDCIESKYPWLVTLWAGLIGIVLVLPFWGILMLIRCKLRLDRWLEFSLAGLHEQRRSVVAVSNPSSQWWILNSQANEKSNGEDRNEETENLVYKLVNMVLGYQEYMARTWNEELGTLVDASTVLLWLSASSALLLTALSMWIFLVNKGGAHTGASFYFAAILTAGCAVPPLYMIRRCFRPEVTPPTITGVVPVADRAVPAGLVRSARSPSAINGVAPVTDRAVPAGLVRTPRYEDDRSRQPPSPPRRFGFCAQRRNRMQTPLHANTAPLLDMGTPSGGTSEPHPTLMA